MKKNNISPSKVYIRDNKVFREVENLRNSLTILNRILSSKFLRDKIVGTQISPTKQNCLEHDLLSYVIHSEEYTVSMAFDVTELALDMALEAEKLHIYSFDLLPHNFTFNNGKWILYDFGAFELDPANVKTQIRSTFKISFAAFELLNVIDRASLKHCFLNRISASKLIKMIPFNRYIVYLLKLKFCQTLLFLKQYRLAYKYLKRFFKSYKKRFKREIFTPKYELGTNCLNTFFEQNDIHSVFCLGIDAANSALNFSQEINVFAYIDDYDLCDKFYNYIIKEKLTNFGVGVLYPLVDDNNIPSDINYRAIYDSYAKERFNFDAVYYENNGKINEKFLLNLADFSNKCIIIKDNTNPENTVNSLNVCYSTVYTKICNNETYVIAVNKINNNIQTTSASRYTNNNRGAEANIQSELIQKILKEV